MLLAGDTETVAVVTPPAFALQVYVLAPLPASTVLCPLQTAAGVAVIVSVGAVFTATEIVSVDTHPPLSPVTV